jgi:hypothetical protein
MRKPKKSAKEAFEDFHADNPQVYALFVRMARHAVSKGAKKLAIAQLFEVARWERQEWMPATDKSQKQFRLCNDYKPHYARLIMAREPDLKDIFNTKRLKVERSSPIYVEMDDGQLGIA